MYYGGDSKGNTGPSIFLIKGKADGKLRNGYNDKYLVDYGAAEGSTIEKNASAFMDTATWEKVTPKVVRGYRNINKHVAANPDWWVLELLDGFGAHFASYEALKIRYDNKVLTGKEEGNSSHVNQAYDQDVAKKDKAAAEEALGFLKNDLCIKYNGHIDAYALLQVSLYAIRSTTPKMWQSSFRRVNLQPSTRRPFKEWCAEISEALDTGSNFKMEEFAVDSYLALPTWWKQFPNSDLQNLRVCYELSKDNPSFLDRVEEEGVREKEDEELVEIHQRSVDNINKNLKMFMLVPPGMSGMNLFSHQVKRRELMFQDKVVSPYLQVEISKANEQVLKHTRKMLHGDQLPAKRIIFCDSYGTNAKHKLAKRKLDSWGSIKSHCGFANSEKKLARYKNMLELAD